VAAALVNRHITPQVRQRERGLAIAAVSGAQQCEEGLVLIDGQELAVAQGPALGCEIKTHYANFG